MTTPKKLAALTGVRRSDAAVDELEALAEALHWRCVVLDGTDVEDRTAFLDACSEAFELPEWFGMNWDALEECLTDLDHEGADGVLVVWSGWGEFAEAASREFAVALDVLVSAVRGWRIDGVPGGVLLVGEGPEIDVEEF
jgi:RNAse (barnase) inhibitor barstar